MLSYTINLSDQTLVVSDMSKVIYQELGFNSFNAEILHGIVGQQEQGFMFQDHLEVYIIKREESFVS